MKACNAITQTCPGENIQCQASPPLHFRAQCITVPGPTDRPTTSHIIGGATTTTPPGEVPCKDNKAKRPDRPVSAPAAPPATTKKPHERRSAPSDIEDIVADTTEDGRSALSVVWPMPWFGAPEGEWVDGSDRKNGPLAGRL
jgi:hypothetical protein